MEPGEREHGGGGPVENDLTATLLIGTRAAPHRAFPLAGMKEVVIEASIPDFTALVGAASRVPCA